MVDWKFRAPSTFPALFFRALYEAYEANGVPITLRYLGRGESLVDLRQEFYYWKHCVLEAPGQAPRAAAIFRSSLVRIGYAQGRVTLTARPHPAAIIAPQLRLPRP